MGDNSVLTISVKPAEGADTLTAKPQIPILSASDNRGNAITFDNGFVNVTCNRIRQDVNFIASAQMLQGLTSIATMSTRSSAQFVPSLSPHASTPHLPTDETVLTGDETVLPSDGSTASSNAPTVPTPANDEASPGDELNNILKHIKRVDIKVTFSKDEPSPLVGVCSRGKADNIIRDRH